MKRREFLSARSVGLAVALCAIFLMAISVQAAGIISLAEWTFDANPPNSAGPYVADNGVYAASSFASGSHAGATTYSSPSGVQSANSYSANNWQVGDYWQFQTSSLGYLGLTFDLHQASSNTGPADFGLFYSTDNNVYTQFGADYTVLANASPNPTWNANLSGAQAAMYSIVFDLSSVGSLNDQPAIYFRLIDRSTTSANGGTVQSAGTDRIDPVIAATVIPEPASVILAGSGLFALAGYEWRRRTRPSRAALKRTRRG